MEYIQIAIDGPAGAGKSTIAKKIAKCLDITYIDTGAMYRALTYKVLVNNVDIYNEEEIIKLARESDIKFFQENIYLDNQKVNEEIRSIEVNKNVSYVAKIREVRLILVNLQRKIALDQDVIMDGRDIGTHVLPNARLKIFLTASVEERATRRYTELKGKCNDISFNEIKKDIINRDKIDSERKSAPLVKAEDAIVIDTTGLSIDDVVEKIIDLLRGE
ncbi:(d)CMP kinase [Alkaliphilus sp. MSJ-5]|uniref:Cytidylate kinase n=1 Tax=Alkaliphilus flagellatus TaxID=2841507 RepID=A0ABS6G5S1_9FIRM|nr:(d)CMP kinase [Alkaliphilus flagellatus]MBU5677509.1 (d)CMP kinase [Alkaliphilus flagellatus]